MTVNEIKAALQIFGGGKSLSNKWLTLDGFINRINLTSDRNLYVDPTTRHYYFDTENELLYVRFVSGPALKYKEGDSIPAGYVRSYDKSTMIQLLDGGGANDTSQSDTEFPEDYSKIGVYHHAIDFSVIGAFINVNTYQKFYSVSLGENEYLIGNVYLSQSGILSFDLVPGASEYEIYDSGKLITKTKTPSVDISDYLDKHETYDIYVICKINGKSAELKNRIYLRYTTYENSDGSLTYDIQTNVYAYQDDGQTVIVGIMKQ